MSQTRTSVTYQEAIAMVGQARLCYAWVKACPNQGIYLKITRAQARYMMHLIRTQFPGVRLLATLDRDGDLLID